MKNSRQFWELQSIGRLTRRIFSSAVYFNEAFHGKSDPEFKTTLGESTTERSIKFRHSVQLRETVIFPL